jgi:hypothetical protein
MLPPGKSVLPIESANNVSPTKTTPSCFEYRLMPPGVWPGVCSTSSFTPARSIIQIVYRLSEHFGVEIVNVNLDFGKQASKRCYTFDMVDVPVSQDYDQRIQLMSIEEFEQLAGFEAGIDYQAVLGGVIFTENVAVGLEVAQNKRVYFHLITPKKTIT